MNNKSLIDAAERVKALLDMRDTMRGVDLELIYGANGLELRQSDLRALVQAVMEAQQPAQSLTDDDTPLAILNGYCIADYHSAPSGIGPKAAEWGNKPHRLLYDLCSALRQVAQQPARSLTDEDERGAFEKWVNRRWPLVRIYDGYLGSTPQALWNAWKARAALTQQEKK